MLNNPVVTKIRAGLVKRVLDALTGMAKNEAEKYLKFWESFGAVLKEGLYEQGADRDKILKLCRFESTANADLTTLEDYIGRMKPGQESIFYIGETREARKQSAT